MKFSGINIKWIILGAICVLTFVCFRYTLGNQFTNWDDDYYVTNDQYIKALTPHNLKVIFTEDITKNNYHPLCMLSLAINYAFAQLSPMTYYLTNILIHIANVVLVFLLLLQLCVRLKVDEYGKLFIAGFGALWFGIHPMHVESVAWIAERKDVLYAFFYLLALLSYVNYVTAAETPSVDGAAPPGKWKWYWITFAMFVLSCLSKPMAVVFPASLLCFDVLLNRKLSKNLITEKIIFFLFSLLCGGAAFYTQNKTGAIASFTTLTLWERFMYAAYGFVMYLSKIFNPTYLSTFYPYPYRYLSGYLPTIYYAAPWLALGIPSLCVYLAYKKSKEYFRMAMFGFGYFVVNIVFVLQFISVGAAIMADRYSYVAYIGLFFMIAYFLYEFVRNNPSLKTAVLVILLFTSSLLGYMCYERTFVWHDAETLLSDAIEKYPMRALLSYKWRGNYYRDIGEYDKALEDYGVLTTLHAADAKVLENIDRINALKANNIMPVNSFNNPADRQVPVATGDLKSHIDRSLALNSAGDTIGAFKEYIQAFKTNPRGYETMMADSAFGYVQRQKYAAAINVYSMLLKLSTSNSFYYFYRGVSEFNTDKLEAAMDDWQTALNPKYTNKDVEKSASYNLAVAYDGLDKDSLAVYYAEKAMGAGYAVTPEYMSKLREKKAAQVKKH